MINKLDIVDINTIKLAHHRKRFKGIEKEGEKTCSKCLVSKLLYMYCSNSRELDGKHNECKKCTSIRSKNQWELNRTKETSRQLTNNGIVTDNKKVCSRCHILLDISKFYKSCMTKSGLSSTCSKCKVFIDYIANRRLKQEMVDAYGGCCSCCGITELEFLTVEHIFGDGKQHRDLVNGHGIKIYKDLKRRGYPKGRHTVLCWNCNCARKYNRPCPHNEKEYNKWLLSLNKREESLASVSQWQ